LLRSTVRLAMDDSLPDDFLKHADHDCASDCAAIVSFLSGIGSAATPTGYVY
jgi:hypothetical protein